MGLGLISGIETCQRDCDCESQSQPFLAHATLSFPREISQVAEGRGEIHSPSFPHLSPSGLGLVNLNPCHLSALARSPFFAHAPVPCPRPLSAPCATDNGRATSGPTGFCLRLCLIKRYLWLPSVHLPASRSLSTIHKLTLRLNLPRRRPPNNFLPGAATRSSMSPSTLPLAYTPRSLHVSSGLPCPSLPSQLEVVRFNVVNFRWPFSPRRYDSPYIHSPLSRFAGDDDYVMQE